MQNQPYELQQAQPKLQLDSVQISKVLRNTYMLLGMTLAFSALVCFLSLSLGLYMPIRGWMGLLIFMAGAYGLMFLTCRFKNSALGLVFCFAFTGFLGWSLTPLLAMYLISAPGVVFSALSMTALVFFGLSAYVLITRKDMKFLTGTIIAGACVLMGAIVFAVIFPQFPGLMLAISAGFVLFASLCILHQTSAIIHGGETNYIIATIGLYVAIYNLFTSLLDLLGAFSGD